MNDLLPILSRMKELLSQDEIPMFRILEMIATEFSSSPYSQVFSDMKNDVFNEGKSITEQMKMNPHLFPKEIINHFYQGEQSGKLVASIEKSIQILSMN